MACSQNPDLQEQTSTDVLSKILDQDEKTKKNLVEIYHKVKLLLSEKPDATLNEEISVRYIDYEKTLEDYPKDLTMDERPIVVTGETGAGKSSILNLLLGFKVFPMSVLPCTGTICRLRTSKTKKADIFDFDDKLVNTIEIEGDDEKKFKTDLKQYVSPKEKRVGHDIKYVDIYWPIPFLRKGIIVVDTPGIGESEEMTERLVQYLPNAVALIFVIDPTHGGGIVKDRIVPLFKAVLGRNINGMRPTFDPSCAMFLCNKWDLIPEDESNEVSEHIRKQLDMYFPNMHDKQVYSLSAKENFDKISKQQELPEAFMKIKRSIQELIIVSLGGKSRQHIFWLKDFLETIRMNSTLHLKNIRLSESKRANLVEGVEKLLKMLKHYRDISKDKLQKEAENVCQSLAKDINNHMHDEKNRKEMFAWDFKNVTFPVKGDIGEIKSAAYKIIEGLVNEELITCFKQYKGNDALDNLLWKVKREFKSALKVQCVLKQHLEHPDELDNNDSDALYYGSIPVTVKGVESTDTYRWENAVLWFPLALVWSLQKILTVSFQYIKNNKEVELYKSEKKKYMTKWAIEYLDTTYTEQFVYDNLKSGIFSHFYQTLDKFYVQELPLTIYFCQKLLHDVQNEARSEKLIRECYQPKLEKCNEILKALDALSSTSTYC